MWVLAADPEGFHLKRSKCAVREWGEMQRGEKNGKGVETLSPREVFVRAFSLGVGF